jgi:hypothetical protein
MMANLTIEQQLRNVAQIVEEVTEVTEVTEVMRPRTGKRRTKTYAQNVDAIAGAARQLAAMVLQYLDADNQEAAPNRAVARYQSGDYVAVQTDEGEASRDLTGRIVEVRSHYLIDVTPLYEQDEPERLTVNDYEILGPA